MNELKFISYSQVIEASKRVKGGLSASELLCPRLGISSTTSYKWRTTYGGTDTSMMTQMLELEAENARLTKCAPRSA